VGGGHLGDLGLGNSRGACDRRPLHEGCIHAMGSGVYFIGRDSCAKQPLLQTAPLRDHLTADLHSAVEARAVCQVECRSQCPGPGFLVVQECVVFPMIVLIPGSEVEQESPGYGEEV